MSLERSCMKAARPWEAQWRQREKRYFSHSVAIHTHNMYQSCSAAAQYSVRINVVPICPSPFAEKSGYLPWFYLQYYQHLKNNYCLSTHVLRQFCCFSVPWCIPSLYQYWLKKRRANFPRKAVLLPFEHGSVCSCLTEQSASKKSNNVFWQLQLIKKASTLRLEDSKLRLSSLCPSQENLQRARLTVKAKLEA